MEFQSTIECISEHVGIIVGSTLLDRYGIATQRGISCHERFADKPIVSITCEFEVNELMTEEERERVARAIRIRLGCDVPDTLTKRHKVQGLNMQTKLVQIEAVCRRDLYQEPRNTVRARTVVSLSC